MYKSKRNDFEIIAWSDKHGILGITALGGLGLMIGTYWWKGTPLQKQQTCYEGGVAAPGVRKGCSWVGSKLEAWAQDPGRRRARAEERSSSGLGEYSGTAWPRGCEGHAPSTDGTAEVRGTLTLPETWVPVSYGLIGLADSSVSVPCWVLVARDGETEQSQAGVLYLKKGNFKNLVGF